MSAAKEKDAYPRLNRDARYKHLEDIHGHLDQFIGGHFSDVNLSALMYAHRLDDKKHITIESWSAPGLSKPLFAEAIKQKYKPAHKGEMFGPSWSNHWFKITVRIPKEFEKYERVQLEFDMSGEAMVFDTEGNVYQGLTGAHEVDRRVDFIIPEEHRKAGIGHYVIEASCNRMFGQNNEAPPDPNKYYKLESCDLVVPNMEAWRLMWDFYAIQQIYHHFPWDSTMRNRAKYIANEIMNVFREGDLSSVTEARKTAENVLGEHWEKICEEESKNAGKQKGTLWAVGHCHIDTAWLWPFSVTQQKSARSWSTQCDLMDRYPEHRFSATQAQQFKWLEQQYPTLFTRILKKVKEGRFQPLGSTWVEMDTNLPSGEALARQFLYGQRYYESRFGKRSKVFVLPDTFGYSSQLPQISRLSGSPNFFTQKLSWNRDNQFPHTTFNWVGLDGSQVLAHMTPVNNYNSNCNIDELRRGMTNHKQLEVSNNALLLFGNGDGGGGPTEPHLQRLRRGRAAGKRREAGGQMPLVKMGGSFDEFYEAIREETKNGATLPVWQGELYLEIHRATYTSHGSIKKGNRKSEILMREAEYHASMASLFNDDYKYPKAELDVAWEDLLLCQFHDVLPGSAIHMVYDDAEKIYAKLHKRVTKIIKDAQDALLAGTVELVPNPAAGPPKPVLTAVNTLPGWERREVVKVPLKEHACVRNHAAQLSKDGKHAYVLFETQAEQLVATPNGLYAHSGQAFAKQEGDAFVLGNDNVVFKISDGRITSIRDVALDRELLGEGQTAGFVVFEDHPNYWDAWDVDSFYVEKRRDLKFDKVSIKDNGPVRASLETTIKYNKSELRFNISVDAVAASLKADARSMIRIDADCDWHERHWFLKFELPLDIHSDHTTYDTQFGTLRRPTHRNTSWDASKFEVCAHKFADLSEYGYGVALINDCKYGYATQGNVLRLSLLRGPTMPDNETDQGRHQFSFAIYPHVGTYTESDVTQVAYAFNAPLRLRLGSAGVASTSFEHPFKVTGADNVILETVKRGEDDKKNGISTLILRVFEQYGGAARATLKISPNLNVKKAELVNILEDPIETINLAQVEDGTTLKLPFRGYEIKTVRLTLGARPKKLRRGSDCWVKI